MPQLFPGQGMLEGVMAGRMAQADLETKQAQVPDIQAQARLRQIQAQAAMMDLAKQQRTEQTLSGLYQNKEFAASPLDRQLEVLGQSLMPFDPDTGLKAFDKSAIMKKNRAEQEREADIQKGLASRFAGEDLNKLGNRTDLSPETMVDVARFLGSRGDSEGALKWAKQADEAKKTQIAMAKAEPELRKLQAETSHYEAETDALRAKQQHGGLEPKDILHAENQLAERWKTTTAPMRETLGKIQMMRNLVSQESTAAPEQVRQGLVDLFAHVRATNLVYKDNANFGDVVDKGENLISRAITGVPSDEYRRQVAKMIDEVQKDLVNPTLENYNRQYEKIAKDGGLDPSHVIIKELGTSKPAEPKPSAQAKSQPKSPVKISSDADYNKLPSGTVFMAPDGKLRKKP